MKSQDIERGVETAPMESQDYENILVKIALVYDGMNWSLADLDYAEP